MVVIALLCTLAHRLAADDKRERIDRELTAFERAFTRQVWELSNKRRSDGKPPPPDRMREVMQSLDANSELPLEMRDLFDPSAVDSTYLAFWDNHGRLLFQSANAPKDLTLPKPPPQDQEYSLRLYESRRELVHSGPRGFRSLVGRDISADKAALRSLALQITGCGVLLWLLGLIGGWWLAGRVIRPIDVISQTATRIAGGNVSERIDVAKTDDELSRLSHVLNDTFDRLESAIKRQQQFTADASHELRTPLTVILSETSRGLKRERSADEYRDILTTCSLAGIRMRSLVESLLILARQEGDGQSQPPHGTCSLQQIVTETLQLLRPLADEKETRISSDLNEVNCQGDSRALSMVTMNLISNAIDHQQAQGEVMIRLRSEEGHAILEVSDKGPGIAEKHLPHLFDRFYRVDPSRPSNGGHSGLGLAIVKAIVTNHGGSIQVESQPGAGSVFRVILPVDEAHLS